MQMMNSAKNYTIIINNNPQGRSLKVAANNILNQENVPSISDYYNKKFKKKTPLEDVAEEEEEQTKKVNVFSDKIKQKFDKSTNKKQEERLQSAKNQKIVKGANGWKRESTT